MVPEGNDSGSNSGIIGIDLGKLAEPATKLVEKVAEGIGGWVRPWQIKRVAHAEAVAMRIEAETRIEISELEQRALRRFVAEEGGKQKNMEAITENAFPQLLDTADPSKIDNDWIANFFEKCRIVSDAEMQVLWSKILAGEANEPGSYSKRTVSLLASLSAQEAEMFTLYCSFCWRSNNGARYSIDTEVASRFWPSKTVPFHVAQVHLRDIGLLGAIGDVSCEWSKLPEREFTYFDESYRLKFGVGYSQPLIEPLFCPFTYPTGAGRELMRIAGGNKIAGYAEAVMTELANAFASYHLEFERISDSSP
jgi:hypothetical protein